MNGTLGSILASKGATTFSISPEATVFEALRLMAEHDIGALAVLDDDKVCGLFSERDYARKIVLQGKLSKETKISEVMTQPAAVVKPGVSIADCMRLMTTQRLRHVLVEDDGRLAGIVSIGDLVNWTIQAQQEAIGQLNSYISGFDPA